MGLNDVHEIIYNSRWMHTDAINQVYNMITCQQLYSGENIWSPADFVRLPQSKKYL